jgi:hypothetical protein
VKKGESGASKSIEIVGLIEKSITTRSTEHIQKERMGEEGENILPRNSGEWRNKCNTGE